jgi:hypothetical protein
MQEDEEEAFEDPEHLSMLRSRNAAVKKLKT